MTLLIAGAVVMAVASLRGSEAGLLAILGVREVKPPAADESTPAAPQPQAIPEVDWAKELAPRNIVVNCITPAAARTEIFKQMKQEHVDYMLARIPMGRFLELDEVTALICWLASEDCSFSTGAVFDISGGRATY